MRKKSITQGVIYASLLSSFTMFTAFRPTAPATLAACQPADSAMRAVATSQTWLHKIVSATGQTVLEYNADKTIRKIVQQQKSGQETYHVVQLPVYENGRLVKSLLSDDANATTGDLYQTFTYNDNQVATITYYRDNQEYAYDSLAYDAAGKMTTRYQFGRNAAKKVWENNGYQQFTWDNEGNITQMDTYGKQPGYSKCVYTSSVTYTYDNKQNPRQQQPELFALLEGGAANLSGHNVLTEAISATNTSQVITNTYTYAYNAGKYPVKATFNSGMTADVVKLEWIKLQ
ncbi:hypothetical protein ACDQ55_13740 [Chitinophaga sp. 30R24]|uniref:hypothetical protein n=1 Tax=Chitinophaga sp. 30R24 TaxID=3248838 RepID=UPI003B90EF64